MTAARRLTNGHTFDCTASAQSDAMENLRDQGLELTPEAILTEALGYLRDGISSCICDRYELRSVSVDPELAVHADDCRQQDADTIREIARVGLKFHFETSMMHFLLSCGRGDTPGFESLQRERVALSTRITELQESLPEGVRESLRMERLTPDTAPAPKVRPEFKIVEENL